MLRYQNQAELASRGRRAERRPTRLKAGVLVLAVLCSGGAWPAVARGGAAKPPRLCIEYLPAIVYEDEAVTLCARVEATGAPAAFLFTASLLDGSGRVLASDLARGTANAGAPWRRHSSLRPERGEPRTLVLRLATPTGARTLAALEIPVLSARKPLPPLQAKGTRLALDSGQRVLVRIEHRVWRRKVTWPLVRWVHRKLYGDTWAASRALVIGDDLGAPEDGYLARLVASRKPPIRALPIASAAGGALPVLRAAAALTRAKLEPTPDLAILCLGWRDADLGADVEQFGKTLELMVQQLERRGCGRCVLVGPAGPSHLRKRLAAYRKAARHVAHTYRGRFLDLAPRLADEHFAGDEAGGRLLLRLPNAKGHAAIADAVLNYLKKITR